MKPPTLTDKARPQSLEAVAYFDGAQGSDLNAGLDRIQATFDQKAAELSHDAVGRAKKHEGLLDRVRVLLPGAEERAAAVNARVGVEKPQAIMPAVCLVGAAFMAMAEVDLLAPALDVLSITDPVTQVFSAIGIMSLSCLAFHFAWETFTSNRIPAVLKLITRAIAVLIAIFLATWGVFRGEQVAFASDLNGNPLGRFLSGHPVLAAAFYVFVTLAVPLVVATATHFGYHHLRDWWEWRKVNRELQLLKEAKVNAQKQLEAEREQHKQALNQLGQECAQWKAIYQIHHERGAQHGARQEPMWLVYLKACGAVLLTGAVLALAGSPTLAIAGGLLVGVAAFVYFRRKREHPNPEEYYKVHNVQFVPQTRNVSAQPEKPLLEAKNGPTRPRKGLPS